MGDAWTLVRPLKSVWETSEEEEDEKVKCVEGR